MVSGVAQVAGSIHINSIVTFLSLLFRQKTDKFPGQATSEKLSIREFWE
jgi:hypothetical protein